MKHRTAFNADARAQLRAIDVTTTRRILRKLAEMESDPYSFDTTEVITRPGVRRLRVGAYRVFYTIDDGQLVVIVVAVAHRGTAYG